MTKKTAAKKQTKTARKKSSLKNDRTESKLRNLRKDEIKKLISQGCESEKWESVYIKNVDISRIKDVIFIGTVKIKNLNGYVEYHKGVKLPASIFRATLMNTSIDGNVYIDNVGRFISNYHIEDGVVIENVGAIYMDGESCFGNGESASPVIEGGGRSVRMYNRLDSHTAYITAMYREKTKMREKIDALIDDYIEKKRSEKGQIKNSAQIINARVIRNSHIDPYATIENTEEINESTIISTEECPSYIGTGVIIDKSIVLKGAYIVDSALIKKSFVGEGVKLSRQFSCEDSLLFANCEGQHGEMFSIFAAPYTVTHHKATLLIASYFSFFNAGSGTNQSNHMYKLGPCHQGFMERGCKTGSNSYILWPSHIGAFSTVLGAHYDNVDASDFPFSYLLEQGDHKTRIIPALNLFGVGLCRDEVKWKARDRRKGNKKDFIIYDVFTPYTASKMITAEKTLSNLMKEHISIGDTESFLVYQKMLIKKLSLEKYASRYSLAIDIYMHDIFLEKIKNCENFDEMRKTLVLPSGETFSEWVDIAGLIAAKKRIFDLVKDIEDERIKTVRELSEAWKQIYESYKDDEWNWIYSMFRKRHLVNLAIANKKQIIAILKKNIMFIKEASEIFEHDVRKEFSMKKQVGFGIDDCLARQDDFNAVRGTVDTNSFVISYRDGVKEKIMSIENLIKQLEEE